MAAEKQDVARINSLGLYDDIAYWLFAYGNIYCRWLYCRQ
jgi:hypothetical protein